MTGTTFWFLLAFNCMIAAQIVSAGESNEQYVSIYNSITKYFILNWNFSGEKSNRPEFHWKKTKRIPF